MYPGLDVGDDNQTSLNPRCLHLAPFPRSLAAKRDLDRAIRVFRRELHSVRSGNFV